MFKKIIILIVLLLAVATGFLFRENIIKAYNEFGKNVQQFQKSDLGNIISQIGKEILTPPPLRIGGSENDVVLVKAKIIAQTNIQRFDNGMLPPLVENAQLNAAALAKAKDMFENQYFEHNSPSGVDPGALVKKYGYDYIVSGENLILGNFASEQEVVQKWMNSPGHRANILHARFSEIGVAMVKGEYEGHTVWIGVQEFGLPLDSCPEPSEALKIQIEAGKADLEARVAAIDAKKQEIDSTSRNSKRYNELVDEYNAMAQEYNAKVQVMKGLIVQYNSQINAFNQCVAGK
ncbi:MAG: hypothetical protein A3C50_03395 [Candidatus Staskawiczbacteria bacterium RIFCSPHIGHO2_02_FULL_43_16]|uniref:SCP domain-containing protein n=1 Tax=Candidatus Staskawiczbacteria bacterium RIFCSPHIGHO2_01_FULL_41_41 TaxID=1802203 RepID=A0A1G2HT06_9BACT|nr:MAG: hypothetical protein A2822_02500 [Candidatus Staskawiczbacteria bacterium RIFCSPHIGHO2_01_FULL_41_41]OGZ67986.1 MAG: hypothetical protein A3C50_03395 [Candidatus Staskawiczbacteria bacterium RIFCSPHIGHO2_02_FULL_43_16]OGZ74551.1 MAG: hypothetical protein A3A12_02195 [Candidatus Staskawiczbacteria bacterium RIFCSPLOWO2_01_FULL_43_17b]